MRSQYHIIGPLKVANTTSSSGIWNLDDQQQARGTNNWPYPAAPVTGRTFTISPAVSGKSTWTLETDGALTITTAGTYTIVASSSYSANL